MEYDIQATQANRTRVSLAIRDIREGVFGTSVWLYLAWQDLKQRYRRSLIGPFWMTISTGVMLSAMGPLYGKLLNQEIGPYFQHLAVSFIVWTFVSTTINESCLAFTAAEGFIKDVKLPYTAHLMRVLAKNLIMFAHNFPVILVVLCFFPPTTLGIVLLAPIGLLLVIANLFWIGLVLAILCTRYRDIPQIVGSLVQVAFFLTPIVWKADMLGHNRFIADWNPLFHLMEVVNSPLLGRYPSTISLAVVLSMAAVGSCFAALLFGRFRPRIAYWV